MATSTGIARTRKQAQGRQARSSTLKFGLFSLLLSGTTPINSVRASADAHRRDDFSFRGPVPEDLHVPHWDFSGSAHRIPSAKDFVRLVSPFPLAYGGMFTEHPIPFDQWSVEIAFRIHGAFSDLHHGHHNETHKSEDEEDITGKGGRGIAFWYSKVPSPTPVVVSANTKKHVEQRPSLVVEPFPDTLDDKVSFFGGPTSFNGLAVVVDNQPSTPLTRRSDRKHWGPEEGGIGAEEWAVVSGVVDDGKGHVKWLEDRKRSDLDEDEEAAYLNHTVGDCQVALRNAAGVVWLKATYVGHQLSVSLDISPHNTLSGENRHYKRECFSAKDVKLPKGYYMGLTGLASPSDEADNVDIYAIEVKEIKGKAKSEEEVTEHYKEEHVAADDVKLEGTGKARDPTNLAFEALNSQRDWAQTIKQMSQKLDVLSSRPSQLVNQAGQTTEHASTGGSGVDHQLEAINTKLDTIIHKIDKVAAPGGPGSSEKTELLQKIHDLEEQSNRHEMFLSEQIEELRHLILNPPPPSYTEDHHFKPLEHQHDELKGGSSSDYHPPAPFADHFQHERVNKEHRKEKMTMLHFLGWSVGAIVLLFGSFKVIQKIIKARNSNNFGSDEGSYFLNNNGPGHSNSALSMTMDTFGFRQRSKKMI
ncbi:hypothetical protein Pst134EA_006776 [Puccinia striiformis f. sp. tritici]|uniref:L-type lectin-like domain-containing protein n=1 Tax=Puccinia striiformis f. sp. tritici PST-78 TaxID=1165861 RepID=A0A0L0V8G5_9BASI|nr:hypothetical protein Pst134EA_006776 [Puccinia striiformis f. sp. tritici]KAH9459710.1 hypothetical protein Pst134EB_007939 [Puccinia striiformis f. sp. tritici]KAH9469486.1 hypothetical protein Pst134EA_006776 [Puccinia striiformis f. sp. tritici]KAI9608902.1 hypothetical protein H4Q26_005095 [Puccinia striiformis f. sp. tritici PST-130]KNE95289.1 hypothetical protein PSTG_11374 [Puccinia striiformis f. sp. tritici PST-78]